VIGIANDEPAFSGIRTSASEIGKKIVLRAESYGISART